ncbi:M23 family metallopeptidase [Sphingomonas sp. MMS12-HWE2-04]|uniref:M23 family metallopeptidase n=1 Tax=Sphingomonas sp. MMS12-HWE2-04 TaxID=3234199 RepID=UPI00384DED91
MTRAKRFGWGLAILLLLAAAAFLSRVRITINPATQPTAAANMAVTPPPPSADRAALIVPVKGVAPAQLSDTWGQSRGGGTREHHAIDIMAPKGTPVLAAASGRVEKIFESGAGGHTIYVRTQDGRTIHYYAHLDSYGVGEGAAVRQGQPIARVGDTGSAADGAPHLHFEIKTLQPGERWWQGVNVNPYPVLARGGGT